MQQNKLSKQLLLILFGLPGSGKSFFARQVGELLDIPVISSDRIRYELFEKPTYTKEESQIVMNVMDIMLEEYSDRNTSAIYDISLNRAIDRKAMREFAKKQNISTVLVWLQADAETCLARSKNRDRRKPDDKYSTEMTDSMFEEIEKAMQTPVHEDVLVISGKHLFNSQKTILLRKLQELQLLSSEMLASSGLVKPQLVNLVSAQIQAGRVDPGRRNLVIT